MTGGLQAAGQRLYTDRHVAPTAAETDNRITYSQQEHSVSTHKSMARVQRPAWADHSHVSAELENGVYHAAGYEVYDRWAEPVGTAETITAEVYLVDSTTLDGGHVVITRDVTLVELSGGIVSLPATAEYADALVTMLAQVVAAEGGHGVAEQLDRILGAVEELKHMVREVAGVPAPTGAASDTFRALARCDHGGSVHAWCPQCDPARTAATR